MRGLQHRYIIYRMFSLLPSRDPIFEGVLQLSKILCFDKIRSSGTRFKGICITLMLLLVISKLVYLMSLLGLCQSIFYSIQKLQKTTKNHYMRFYNLLFLS